MLDLAVLPGTVDLLMAFNGVIVFSICITLIPLNGSSYLIKWIINKIVDFSCLHQFPRI